MADCLEKRTLYILTAIGACLIVVPIVISVILGGFSGDKEKIVAHIFWCCMIAPFLGILFLAGSIDSLQNNYGVWTRRNKIRYSGGGGRSNPTEEGPSYESQKDTGADDLYDYYGSKRQP